MGVQYRRMGKTGDMVSILGFGCMRFPRSGGRIDEKKTERLVALAIERGVNYFDTAYIYFGSEAVLGNILSKGLRDKVFIATKMPLVQVGSRRDMERMLDVQLQRLRTDRIDYYLMHNLMTCEAWERLVRLGVEDFIESARKAGKIRHVGFSSHGRRDQFVKLVDAYEWDMAMIQYNYLDENNQAGREGLFYAASKGLGVAVMEPLRGGYLVDKLPGEVRAVFDAAEPKRSPAEWGLRWVWNHPEVTLLLSGMNDEAQIDENARAASEASPGSLTESELAMFEEVKRAVAAKIRVPCTGCSYCLPCPAGVDIPACFSVYNDRHVHGGAGRVAAYIVRMSGLDGGSPSHASLCRGCGECEKKCPQGLPIREMLREVAREMEKFYFRPAVGLVRAYVNIKGKGRGRKTSGEAD